jgi:hypothetical protein
MSSSRYKFICDFKRTILWDITPCSQLKVNRRFGGDTFLRNIGWLSTRYTGYIPEGSPLHTHRCEDLRYYLFMVYLKT